MTNSIKTEQELKDLFESIQDQGFSYLDIFPSINSRLRKGIRIANEFDLDITDTLFNKLKKEFYAGNFIDWDLRMKEYFSQFTKEDKMKEIVKNMYIEVVKNYVKIFYSTYITFRINELSRLMEYDFELIFNRHFSSDPREGTFEGGSYKIFKDDSIGIYGQFGKDIEKVYNQIQLERKKS